MSLNSTNKFRNNNITLKPAIFLHTVREPLKQSKLDFNKSKHIFVRIQFMLIDIGKSRFSDNKSDKLE